MKTDQRIITILLYSACGLILIPPVGCSKPDTGPKREDHAKAHARRYHPNVQRADATGTPASQLENNSAHAVTRPTDIDFDAGPVGCPVLFVNDDTLTVQEVLEPILEELKEKAETLSLTAYRNHIFRAIGGQIEYQISMLVLHQQAKQKFSEERMQQAFDKEANRLVKDLIDHRYTGSTARYEAHLKALGLTLDGIKARAKRQAMVMQFLQDRFKPLVGNPTRRELQKYYQLHLDEFTTSAKAELFLIEIPLASELANPLAGATPVEIESARANARKQLERAQQELESGVEFTAVAKKYSKGVRARTGGAWGEISPDALTGRWSEAAQVLFTLRSNEISDIIETDESLFIVKCGQYTPENQFTFEQAQQQIIQRFAADDFENRRQAYIRELMARATIHPHEAFFHAVLAAAPRPVALNANRNPKTAECQ